MQRDYCIYSNLKLGFLSPIQHEKKKTPHVGFEYKVVRGGAGGCCGFDSDPDLGQESVGRRWTV